MRTDSASADARNVSRPARVLVLSLAAVPAGADAFDLRVTPAVIGNVSFADAQEESQGAGIVRLDPITVYSPEFIDGLGGLDPKLRRAIPCVGTCMDSGREPVSRLVGVLTRLLLGDAPAEPPPRDIQLEMDVRRAVTRADKLP